MIKRNLSGRRLDNWIIWPFSNLTNYACRGDVRTIKIKFTVIAGLLSMDDYCSRAACQETDYGERRTLRDVTLRDTHNKRYQNRLYVIDKAGSDPMHHHWLIFHGQKNLTNSGDCKGLAMEKWLWTSATEPVIRKCNRVLSHLLASSRLVPVEKSKYSSTWF